MWRALGFVVGVSGPGGVANAAKATFAYHVWVWRTLWRLAPKPSGGAPKAGNSTTSHCLALFLALAALGFLPGVAHAAAQAIASVVAESDLALRAIRLLYTQDTPLARAVSWGTTMLTYAAVGTIGLSLFKTLFNGASSGSITDGPTSGQGLIRAVIALGLLFPVTALNGLSASQVGVAKALEASSNIATEMAVKFTSDVLGASEAGVGHLGIPASVGGMTMARQVIQSEACAETQATYIYNIRQHTSPGGAVPPPAEPDLPPAEGVERAGVQVWNYARLGRCGGLTLPAPATGDTAATLAYKRARIAALAGLVEAIRDSELPRELAAGTLPNTGYAWPVDPIIPRVRDAAYQYDAKLLSASAAYLAQNQIDGRRDAVAALKATGWPAFGTVFSTIGAASASAVALASEPPVYRQPDDVGLPREWDTLQSRLTREWADESRVPGFSGATFAEAGDTSASIFARLVNAVTRPVTEALTRWMHTNDSNPMGESIALGHWITGSVEVAKLAEIAIAAGACNAVSSVAGACAAYQAAVAWVGPFMWVLYGIGWTHAYLLPMLPFIGMTMAFVTFLIAAVELLVGLPILMVAAAKPEKDIFHDALWPGVALVLNALLRAPLAVFGQMCMYYLLPSALALVNKTYGAAFVGVTGGYTLGIGGIVGSLVLMAWVQWQIQIRILSLGHELPDRILRYWGGQSGEASNEGRATAAATGAVLGAMAGKGGGSLPGSGGSGASPSKGGSSVGIRPSGNMASSASSGEPWYKNSGTLTGEQEQQARKAYDAWKESSGSNWSFGQYVNHAVSAEANRNRK